MKSHWFGAAVVGAIAQLTAVGAFAADLPEKAPSPPCVWCGWYLGINAGWVGSANNNATNTGTDTGTGGLGNELVAGALPTSMNVRFSGFLGGWQIGYNWQSGNVVFGLEADFDGSGASGSSIAQGLIVPTVGVPTALSVSRQLEWLATFRGRLGVTVSPNLLAYVTGGAAVGGVRTGDAWGCPGCGPASSTEPTTVNTSQSTRAGGTVGAGLEWMVAPKWSIKAEYLYANLGRSSSTIAYTYGGNSTLTSSVRNNVNIARAGINWHF
jgi:outer membrane immunogenic protein